MEKFNMLEGRTREWNSTDYQGKRKEQYESTIKSMNMGCVGMFFIIVSMIVYGILF